MGSARQSRRRLRHPNRTSVPGGDRRFQTFDPEYGGRRRGDALSVSGDERRSKDREFRGPQGLRKSIFEKGQRSGQDRDEAVEPVPVYAGAVRLRRCGVRREAGGLGREVRGHGTRACVVAKDNLLDPAPRGSCSRLGLDCYCVGRTPFGALHPGTGYFVSVGQRSRGRRRTQEALTPSSWRDRKSVV